MSDLTPLEDVNGTINYLRPGQFTMNIDQTEEEGVVITDSKVNSLFLEDVGIYLEAYNNRILVVSDPYKSGYECKTCNATGKVKSNVVEGALKDCEACNGIGHTIIIPDKIKSVPTSGIILSIGPNCTILNRKDHLGQRVLIGPYVGTGIPIKGQIRIRSLREDEIICFIWGEKGEDKDFIEYESVL